MVDVFAKQLREILDSDGSVRPGYLVKRGWRSVLSIDPFRAIEADWLTRAITPDAGMTEICAIMAADYEDVRKINSAPLNCDRDAINFHVSDKNIFHTVIADPQISFLTYFSRFRDYFLICGSEQFLSKAYPVSADTVRCQYFEGVAHLAELEPIRPSYFDVLWTRYSIQCTDVA